MINRILLTPRELSTTLSAITDFDVVFAPDQIATIEIAFLVSFPENHGGLQHNIVLPTNSGWTAFRIDPWLMRIANSGDTYIVMGDTDPVTPANANYEQFAPGADAVDYQFKSKWLIKAPSGGGTLRVNMSAISSAATPSLMIGCIEVDEIVVE